MTHDVRFEARCGRCGPLDLGAEQIWLVVASVPSWSYFGFHCPTCRTQVRQHADATTIAVLGGRVAVEELEVPAEAIEAHDGPSLTTDDLIDFMLDLRRLDCASDVAQHA